MKYIDPCYCFYLGISMNRNDLAIIEIHFYILTKSQYFVFFNSIVFIIEIQSLHLTQGQKIGKSGKLNYITRQCRHKINVHKFSS